tara:strand:- start:27273 stop:27473 length:201 start_codon:yes stop_codon:yes gene_type:complete
MSVEVHIRKGEPVEKALRRLKKRMMREDVIGTVREKRYFVKPAQRKRKTKKEQAFKDMLRIRRESI